MEPTPGPGEPDLSPALLTIFSVTLMAVLGVSSVAPAFPSIARELGATSSEVGALITAFTLPGVLLAPLFGGLADRFGRKQVLVPSLLLFAVAGTSCAFARDLRVLVLLRFVQGLGAAPLGSVNLTLIGDLFEGRRQVVAMGRNAAVLSVGTASYPLIGGVLADLDWRWPFLLPALAVPVAAAAAWVLPPAPSAPRGTARSYLARVRAATTREILLLMLASLLTFVILYGSFLTFLPFLMADRFSASSTSIGLVLSSTSVLTALVSLRLGPLTARFGRRGLLVLAYLAYVVSMLLVPLMPSFAWLVLPAALFGAGNGLNIPTLQAWIAREVDHDVRAGVMALNAMALRGGQTLGPLLIGVAQTRSGAEGAFGAGAATGAVLLALTLIGLRRERDGSADRR